MYIIFDKTLKNVCLPPRADHENFYTQNKTKCQKAICLFNMIINRLSE